RAQVQAEPAVHRHALVQAIEEAGYDVPAGTLELSVDGMSCASCVGRVEAALRKVPGVQAVAVNLATERATIRGNADPSALLEAVDTAGYDARLIDDGARPDSEDALIKKDAERNRLKRDFFVALALALPVFVLEMG